MINASVPNPDDHVDGRHGPAPSGHASAQHVRIEMPVPVPDQVIRQTLAKLVKGEWRPQDDGTEVLEPGRQTTVANVLPVFMGLTHRPVNRDERMRLDADFDAFYSCQEFPPVERLWWELGRMWWGTRIMPSDNQLTDALKALPSYTLPPPPEDELDEEDDTVPPAPPLVERLAYLVELGSGGPGYTATPISARRAGIIKAAMEAASQEDQTAEQEITPMKEASSSSAAETGVDVPQAGWSAVERANGMLEEIKRTGDPTRLYAASVLLMALADIDFADFIAACKRANRESCNGLDIDIALLRKVRRDRKANGRAWARSQPEAIPGVELATHQLAKLITDEAHFAVDAGRKLYVFLDGVYVPSGEAYIKRRTKSIMIASTKPDQWAKRKVEEAVEFITVDAPVLWDAPPLDHISVLNGVLNVNTRVLEPHTPEFLSPIQIPIRYDPAATCPCWEKFVGTTFPPDAVAIAWEIPAWLMAPDTSIQKAILLTGDGANGKSTYLAAVLAFIGRRNASAVSLHKLEGDRFSVSRLVGKLANVCPDLPSTDLASTSVFKAITGGDVLTGERKFESSFDFTPYARLVFSANHPPKSQDASPAFFRRWLVVPFERTFAAGAEGTIPRGQLDAMLADPGELSGVLNKALEFLPRLRRDGFTECESTRQAMNEFRQTTDPMAVWLDNNTLVKSGAFVAADHIFNLYSLECARKNRPTPTTTAFGRAISHLRPTVEKKQRTVNGALRWCYVGIGLLTSDSE